MPLFPVLDHESLVQENDKTRLTASKSYASGVGEITKLEIKPSKSVAAINVTELGYLDWQYEFKIEIDALNNKLNFKESGAELTATLATGEYSLSALAAEIQTKMRTAGALLYVVGVSADDEFTIAAPSAFQLLPEGTNASTSILPAIGFSEDLAGEITYTGEEVERITKTVSLIVTNYDGSKTITRSIEVISERADMLFSSDDRLRKHEQDVLKYIPDGRASFKDVHRRAQTLILAWLDTEGFIDNLGDKLTIRSFTDREEFAEWATMMALRLIFESVMTATDDVYAEKAKKYGGLEAFYRGRANISIDADQDGDADAVEERLDIRSCRVVRR